MTFEAGLPSIADSAHNFYSQHGEDGILAELFRRLDLNSGYFVEFGAWDGMRYSNTYMLAQSGWSGCYIEGDPARYDTLRRNVPQESIRKVIRFVQPSGPDSLDSILQEVGAPRVPEVLSIDIDSDDLAVWRGLKTFRPLCVVIEYNPTIPYDTRFENVSGKNWGNGPRSITEHAAGTGYRLVAVTRTNLIFLDSHSSRDNEAAVRTICLADVEPSLRYFFGMDGSLLHITEPDVTVARAPEFYRVPWTKAIAAQPVPRRLRRYVDNDESFMRRRRTVMAAAAGLSRPIAMVRALTASRRSGS